MKEKTKGKKKLAEMTADEFMEHGLDSDDSLSELEDEEVSHRKHPNKKSIKAKESDDGKKEKSHKSQLERLKEKDPEFYKYLQENDEELLDFSASDEDVSDESGAEDELDEEVKSKEKDKIDEGENSEQDNNEEEEEEDPDVKEGKRVTHEMISRWKASLEKETLKTLKTVMAAFHASVSAMAPSEEAEEAPKQTRFSAKEGTIFNSLATLCLKYTVKILDKNIHYAKDKKTKNPMLPSSSKSWSKIKVTIKQYLLDLLQLLRQMSEPSMLTIILRHCQLMCPYFCCFPKILKMFLKRLTRMWSSGEEHVRVLAFMCIRRGTTLHPNLFEFTLKKMYFGFVQNSKFVTLKMKPVLVFMQNSLVEMFSINETITYQHAFVYIRQLAIHLRNAITIKKKDAHLAVYNWQFISCLQLWSHVVGELYGDTLKPLVYPVVQITLGVIRLVPAARYFPIRFQCIDILNYLSKQTNVYIPTASYILEAIGSNEFLKKPKTTDKTPDLKSVLKVSKAQTTSKGFQDAIVDLSFESLLEHYVIYSNSIAFPELIFPVCHRLKRLTKNCKVFKLAKDMKTLVDKLQKHGEALGKTRSGVTFSPKDVEQVREWELQQREKQNSLDQFYETWKQMKTIKADESVEPEQDKDEKATKKRKRKQQRNDDQSEREQSGESTEPPKSKKGKREKGKTKKKTPAQHDEDILEDFEFSDDDDK